MTSTETAISVIPGVAEVRDETGLPPGTVSNGLARMTREISLWVQNVRAAAQRASMFDRGTFSVSDDPFDRMRAARLAVEGDNIVSSVANATETMMFQGSKVESRDADEADVFNQVWTDLNGDRILRTWWRELFTYSQCYLGVWWGHRTYQVRGYTAPKPVGLEKKTDPVTGAVTYEVPRDPETNLPKKADKRGAKRRQKFTLTVPTALTFLDPMKIVPVGQTIFGADQLAWHATSWEIGQYDRLINGEIVDQLMSTWMVGKYEPVNLMELEQLTQLKGVDYTKLILLNPKNAFRHTRTKPDYQRFADVRLRAVFQLLDLKQQLLESDRVALVGAANYILLVKKGNDANPAQQPELDNLNAGMKVLAKLPVIVSDHRLEVQIVVPPQEHVLDGAKYDTIDKRIHDAAMGSLLSQNATRADTTLTSARAVSRFLESERLMIKRTIEERLFRAIVEHPENKDKLSGEIPNLTFTPRNIQLDTEQQVVQALMTLRASKDISRETILEYFGLDEEVEAQRRIWEEESGMDEIFGTAVPFSSPANNGAPPPPGAQQGPNGAPVPPAVNGAQGGRPPGGGQSPQSPASQTKPRSATGGKSTTKGQPSGR